MSESAKAAKPAGIVAKTARRVAVALAISVGAGLLILYPWLNHAEEPVSVLFLRTLLLGLPATAAFTFFEAWPRRLPRWLQRWVLQVVAVGVLMPVTTWHIYVLTTPAGAPPFWKTPGRIDGFLLLTYAGLLVAPWSAFVAIVRQKEAFAREQHLAFALERSELERQALDARLHLLQAQVAPHFLFNTLANVQALVEAGSPHAPAVLRSLTAYLRAAVPLLPSSNGEPATTIEQELQLVRPYLELMQMRMPDRLQYAMRVDPSALEVRCPPTTLLTLVENAVRHGIDPSEEGGRIDIDIERRGDRCVVRVNDTGAGFHPSASGHGRQRLSAQPSRSAPVGEAPKGPGTGLTTLRERLRLTFGDAAELRLTSGDRGVAAEVELPAQT